jgi:hypothetical protein
MRTVVTGTPAHGVGDFYTEARIHIAVSAEAAKVLARVLRAAAIPETGFVEPIPRSELDSLHDLGIDIEDEIDHIND